MKICLLISSLKAGGKERQFLYLVNELSNNHDVQIVVFSEHIFFKEIYDTNAHITIIPKESRYTLRTLSIINKTLKKQKPDVIHIWDHFIQLFISYYQHFHEVKVINGAIRHGGALKYKPYFRLLKTFALRKADKVISNSKQGLVVEQLENHPKAKTIYNGIDNSKFLLMPDRPEFLSKSKQKYNNLKIIMLGRFDAAKDYKTFISAALLMNEINPDIHFYCVGDGPGYNNAKTHAGSLIGKNIFFLGRRNDVHLLLHTYDVGVLLNNTNRHAEGISNAIMEYMAAGLPVIATNAGGSPEIIKHELTGFLVSPNDPDAVLARIIELDNNIELRFRMGRKGREIIEKNFSVENMSNRYLEQYSQ